MFTSGLGLEIIPLLKNKKENELNLMLEPFCKTKRCFAFLNEFSNLVDGLFVSFSPTVSSTFVDVRLNTTKETKAFYNTAKTQLFIFLNLKLLSQYSYCTDVLQFNTMDRLHYGQNFEKS